MCTGIWEKPAGIVREYNPRSLLDTLEIPEIVSAEKRVSASVFELTAIKRGNKKCKSLIELPMRPKRKRSGRGRLRRVGTI